MKQISARIAGSAVEIRILVPSEHKFGILRYTKLTTLRADGFF